MNKYFLICVLLTSAMFAQPRNITAADAAQIEESIQKNPDDTRRVFLVPYYAEQNDTQASVKHLYWLIEHHPEWPWTSIVKAPSGASYEHAKQLWLTQISARGAELNVLINAGRFFNEADPDLSLQQYRRAYSQFPKDRMAIAALGQQYGRILNAPEQFDALLARSVTDDLATSTDAQLLWIAGSSIRRNPDMAGKLKDRAKAIDPNIEPRPMAQAAFPDTPGVKRIRIGEAVQAAKLKTFQPAEYPPLAKQARIQGTVRFEALIAIDGTVKTVQLVSGHPLLVVPAQEALKKWVYQTTLLNGEPVEVVSTVDVVFTLNP